MANVPNFRFSIRMLTATVLSVALLLAALPSCQSQQTLYIEPSNGTRCSVDQHPCYTLSQCADNDLITSNTTLLLLNGIHYLESKITVTNVTNVSLLGDLSSDSQIEIICSNSASLEFSELEQLLLNNLDFVSCGSHSESGIRINTVNYFELNNCTVRESVNTTAFFVNESSGILKRCAFINNSPQDTQNDVVLLISSSLTFQVSLMLLNNMAFVRGAMELRTNTTIIGVTGIFSIEDSNVSFSGVNNFINNQFSSDDIDCLGGAIYIGNSNVSFEGTTHFRNNSVSSNMVASYGGAIFAEKSNLAFSGTTCFDSNDATSGGGAIYVGNSTLFFHGDNHFVWNSASFGGGLLVRRSTVHFLGSISFSSNTAINSGGAVHASLLSTLIFTGKGNAFEYNSAIRGGALWFSTLSKCVLEPNTLVTFIGNNATGRGGAIRAQDSSLTYCTTTQPHTYSGTDTSDECFFKVPSGNYPDPQVSLIFINNTATEAGSVLYGGSLGRCQFTPDSFYERENSGDVFKNISRIESPNLYTSKSEISSDPYQVCTCNITSKTTNCSVQSVSRKVYPGQQVTMHAVIVGQLNGTVPGTVEVVEGRDKIGHLQDTQITGTNCTTLGFVVFSNRSNETLGLHAQRMCLGLSRSLRVHIELEPCPSGFAISDDLESPGCDCEERLQPYTDTCNIDDQTILRTGQFWVGFDNESEGIILYEICPFYYCVDYPVNITLNNTDLQCGYNRAGLLCGECKPGFSLTLGNPHCRECSNRYLALLIPFAVAGVVIVLLLYVLDLTVPHGTLSGLIFYANIVSVTWRAFPHEEFSFLQMFIAWLNLDLGIETCFYNGLDVYAKMWLQFVFPIYIWALVGVIVMISRYSSKVTKLLGTNSVSVLATLLFLTYTKILRTIIIAIAFASLEYPDNETHVVWLYDANIKYLKGKHIVLFVAALVFFLVLFTPYTLFLIFGQWLLAKSHLRVFKWVNRLKPFLDAYHSPYKPKHRYWPGLLLFIRCILSLALAFNIIGNPTLDFLYVSTGAIVVLTWGWIAGGMYKNWYLDALEASFVLNLGVFAASCYQTVTEEGNTIYTNKKHKAIAYTFTGVAFLEFLGILAYHIYLKFRHAKPNMNRKQLQVSLTQFVRRQSSSKEEDICHTGSSFANGESAKSSRSPTVSYISLSTSKSTDASDPQLSPRQSLTTSYDACLIREPLLGSDFHEQS